MYLIIIIHKNIVDSFWEKVGSQNLGQLPCFFCVSLRGSGKIREKTGEQKQQHDRAKVRTESVIEEAP